MARDSGHYQYPKIIRNKAKNIEDGIYFYKKHLQNSYDIRYNKKSPYWPFNIRSGHKNIA